MVGDTYRGGGLPALIGLMGLFVSLAMPVQAQPKPDYRKSSPQALLKAWQGAPRFEKAAVAAAIVERRTEVLPLLRDKVRSGDRDEKMFACSVIAETRDRDGVAALLTATADPDVKVRRRAATALRILSDRRAAARLRELLRSEPDLGVLKTAIVALGRLGQQADVALIVPFLTHADYGVGVVAAGALAMLGDQRGLDLVIQATYSSDPGLQKSATYALGFFAAPPAGERLQAILADPNGAWKSYALIALAERKLAQQSTAEQIQTLDGLARGRSRTLAEWSVERLTDIGTPAAAAALAKAADRSSPVGGMAARRLNLLEGKP